SEFSSPETGLVVLIFQKGDDPIDAINHMMSFLTSVVTSRGGRIICRLVHRDRLRQDQEEHLEGKRDNWSSQESVPTFAEFFEINNLKAQAQAKDTVILILKEKLNSLNGDVKDRNVKRDVEEIETLNIELDHKRAHGGSSTPKLAFVITSFHLCKA
nr:hypothetical protein [Tanacetum cinerariifolium]